MYKPTQEYILDINIMTKYIGKKLQVFTNATNNLSLNFSKRVYNDDGRKVKLNYLGEIQHKNYLIEVKSYSC